jgi:hypothetical protein
MSGISILFEKFHFKKIESYFTLIYIILIYKNNTNESKRCNDSKIP